MTNTGLFQQYAMNFDPDFKYKDVQAPFNLTGILTNLNKKHLMLNFFQYEEQLHLLDIYYLETENEYKTQFYEHGKIGMMEEAAILFQQYVAMEYDKALLEHMWGKWMESRIANSHVPIHFS